MKPKFLFKLIYYSVIKIYIHCISVINKADKVERPQNVFNITAWY